MIFHFQPVTAIAGWLMLLPLWLTAQSLLSRRIIIIKTIIAHPNQNLVGIATQIVRIYRWLSDIYISHEREI